MRGKKALADHHELMVITNNINVANRLRVFPGIEVVIAGGVVRGSDGGIVGEAAVDFIRQFNVDFAVIGVSAIDEDGADDSCWVNDDEHERDEVEDDDDGGTVL